MRSAKCESPEVRCRRVALATCAEMPDLDSDTQLLLKPLHAIGIEARAAVWDDPRLDWASFDVVIVRSCWDYIHRREAFLGWCARVRNLANPPNVLEWNTHKEYLRVCAAAGLPVVPTTWLNATESWQFPAGGEWVIKPAISLASLDTGRYRMEDPTHRALACAHILRLQRAERMVMIQPYVDSIEEQGEISLIFLGGEFSHAVRKPAVLKGPDDGADRRFMPIDPTRMRLHVPTQADLALARRALACVPGGIDALLYARVDIVPGPQHQKLLLEIELVEPQLFLELGSAAERFATLIAERVLALGDKSCLPRGQIAHAVESVTALVCD